VRVCGGGFAWFVVVCLPIGIGMLYPLAVVVGLNEFIGGVSSGRAVGLRL